MPALHPWRFGAQAVVLPHDLNFYPPHPWLMEILPSGGPDLKSGPASLEETHTGESLQWFIQSSKKGNRE